MCRSEGWLCGVSSPIIRWIPAVRRMSPGYVANVLLTEPSSLVVSVYILCVHVCLCKWVHECVHMWRPWTNAGSLFSGSYSLHWTQSWLIQWVKLARMPSLSKCWDCRWATMLTRCLLGCGVLSSGSQASTALCTKPAPQLDSDILIVKY